MGKGFDHDMYLKFQEPPGVEEIDEFLAEFG
jgi:hypothetical protein